MEKYDFRAVYKKSENCLHDSPHINCDTEVQESQKSVMEKYNLRSRKARNGSSLKKVYKKPGNCLRDSQDINCNSEVQESQKSIMEECNLRSRKTRIGSSLKKPGNCLQDSQNINCDTDVEESNISFQIMSEYESKKVERPFKCRICETAFTRKDHLRTHEKRHTGDYKKQCEICFKTYSNLFNLRQHMNTIHNATTKYQCKLCLREFTNKSSLTYHTKAQHSNENIIYSCALCSKTFFSPAQVRKHSKMHNGRNHTCTICGLAFSKLSALRSHKAAIHIPFVGPKPYHSLNDNTKMEIFLDNGSELAESLGIDRVIKEENVDYHSMSCDEYGLPNTESEIDIDKCQAIETNFSNSIRCTICEKILVSDHSYMIHMRIHNGDMPYKCDKCPKSFSLPRILKIHKRTHKKRECDICGRTLSHSNALKAHMRLHTGERPFKCNICTRAFTTKSFLKYHKSSQHTGERNYTCTKCEKSFFSKSHLTRHSLSHNQIKGIICEICGTVFLKRTYMVQHKIDVHNISSAGTNSVKHQARKNLKRITCGICENTLKVNTIRTHILIKHPDRVKCECNHCGNYFDTIDALVVHQKTDCLKCVGTNQEEQEFTAGESSVA